MLRCMRNSLGLLWAGALLWASAVQAVVVIEYGNVQPPPPAFASRAMPGLVLTPVPTTQAGQLIQRSHAWRGHSRVDSRTGALLVYPQGSASATPRQQDIRNNVARAHAYRLDYYKR